MFANLRNRQSSTSVTENNDISQAQLIDALQDSDKRFSLVEHNQTYLERGIAQYRSMSESSKIKFENLYFLARYPVLLKANESAECIDSERLPNNLPDLQALAYFIFRDNLCNCWSDGVNHEISPFLPFKWSEQDGLRVPEMRRASSYFALVETLNPISSSTSLYFSVLIISMELTRSPDETEDNYRLLILLLATVLDGVYDQTCLTSIKAQSASLKDPWLLNFLPTPPLAIDLSLSQTTETLKTTLLGRGLVRGMFEPYREPSAIALPVAIVEPNSVARRRQMCLIL